MHKWTGNVRWWEIAGRGQTENQFEQAAVLDESSSQGRQRLKSLARSKASSTKVTAASEFVDYQFTQTVPSSNTRGRRGRGSRGGRLPGSRGGRGSSRRQGQQNFLLDSGMHEICESLMDAASEDVVAAATDKGRGSAEGAENESNAA